jgi:phosphate starvation-inducible PhoH-like protein
MAVRALKAKEVKRIILTRPAVEAGENLGFLPGDLKEKLDPYLMPLYDALRDMIPAEKLADMIEFGVIEIAPLAFMRGRTLDKAFVILDEAQNTTQMQMKMFLTRMGMTAKFVITGDMSQVDLPSKQRSGLSYALDVLKDIDDIQIIRLGQSDVIRHRLVKQIIEAFDVQEQKDKQEKLEKQAQKEQQS